MGDRRQSTAAFVSARKNAVTWPSSCVIPPLRRAPVHCVKINSSAHHTKGAGCLVLWYHVVVPYGNATTRTLEVRSRTITHFERSFSCITLSVDILATRYSHSNIYGTVRHAQRQKQEYMSTCAHNSCTMSMMTCSTAL